MTILEDSARGRIAYDGTRTPLKTALFLLVCVAWLLPGLVGHDPWKYDEAVVFGAVNEILKSGDWVSFRIAGEPFLDRAPLFMWVAALFAKVFGLVLPVPDAARLASGFFMACTLALISAASRELMGARAVREAVLLFIGCLGLLLRAHEMMPDLAGLTGIALGLHGLIVSARRPRLGGALAGAGVGVAFLGNGFLPAALLVATWAALPAASPLWRTRAYGQALGIAVLVAAPLVALWPAMLAFSGPGSLGAWLASATASRWTDATGSERFSEMFYFARVLPWYAWPAWPLAAWTLWRARRTFAGRRDVMLPAIAFVVFFLAVSIFGDSREPNGLVLLVPLALLGVAELDSLPRGAASALDWFGMMTFLLIAALLWVGYVAAMTGRPEAAAAAIAREVPGFKYPFSFIAFALASLLTLVWVAVVARSLRSNRRALVNWAAGITMAWMLMMTLGLPLVDTARSYRTLAARVAARIPPGTCVARRNVADAQRALLDYFVGLRTVRLEDPAAARCGMLLAQASPSRIVPPGSGWTEAWRGSRPGDRNELFILYRRTGASR
ncbi:MAG TPA: glycosyltransferase family 39 protein [Usitatibacter sp.]|nr:glycosyltransferase family 39 protein [Usitatibacter sp.]